MIRKIINTFKRKPIYLLYIILLGGFLVRLYKIDNPIADWHSFRQADTASVSRYYMENGINLLYPKYHDLSRIQSGIRNAEGFRYVEFPIYNLFQAALTKYIPIFSLEIWGRLVSIVSALFSAYILYLLGKRYISEWGGIIAAFFYAFIPYNIYFTRVILPEPMAILFALWSLYLFTRYFDSRNLRILIFSAILFSVSVLIKPYTVFYGLPILFLLFQTNSYKQIFKDKNNWVFALIVLVPFFLWRMWISRHPEGIPFWKWTFNGDGIRFKPAFWFWIFGERLTKLILGFGGVLPFFVGIMAYEKKYKFIHAFILGMFLFVSVIATANVRHDYYQSIIIPAVSLVFALGVIKLWTIKEFNQKVAKGLLVFLTLLMFLTGAYQVKDYYRVNHWEIIRAGEAVDRLTPKDSIIIAAYNGDTAFLYQTKRRGYPNVELPIEELIAEGAEYYTSVNLHDTQTIEFMNKFPILEKTNEYVVLKLK